MPDGGTYKGPRVSPYLRISTFTLVSIAALEYLVSQAKFSNSSDHDTETTSSRPPGIPGARRLPRLND